MNNLLNYTIRIADNCLIAGHRLSEWCGHGPVLEQDIAMTNMALDLVGQARNLYALAADIQGEGKTEDDLAYLRDVFDFKNLLLVEQPNGDFAHTIVKQFFFSAFQLPFYKELLHVLSNPQADAAVEYLAIPADWQAGLRGVAEKAVKEISYHLRWSSEWVIRLGDGTEESHNRMKTAINTLYTYSGEAFIADTIDKKAVEEGYGVDLETIKSAFDTIVESVLSEATLPYPHNAFMQKGGKQGYHTEHLGYLLAEMQFMQRAYPNSVW